MVTPVPTGPLAGVKPVIVGGVALDTVTVTATDVVRLPAASRATAVSVCEPLVAVVVFHETAYGTVVSSAPRLAPSSLNWTPTTPTLSDAFAVTVTVDLTVAPFTGDVMLTVGGVVSLDTVTVTAADVAVLPAASRATALSVCEPLVAVVVFHETEYGSVVSSPPRLAPSSLNCTPATVRAPIILTFALTVVVRLTVDPDDGDVMVTISLPKGRPGRPPNCANAGPVVVQSK